MFHFARISSFFAFFSSFSVIEISSPRCAAGRLHISRRVRGAGPPRSQHFSDQGTEYNTFLHNVHRDPFICLDPFIVHYFIINLTSSAFP